MDFSGPGHLSAEPSLVLVPDLRVSDGLTPLRSSWRLQRLVGSSIGKACVLEAGRPAFELPATIYQLCDILFPVILAIKLG